MEVFTLLWSKNGLHKYPPPHSEVFHTMLHLYDTTGRTEHDCRIQIALEAKSKFLALKTMNSRGESDIEISEARNMWIRFFLDWGKAAGGLQNPCSKIYSHFAKMPLLPK